MNSKFFDVKKDKQDAIINAALKIFAGNGYRNASTDIIVKEAGISKGLLFHYFDSKQGLYDFIYDYSVKYMSLELTQAVKKSEKDFFAVQRKIALARTRVMRNYPYMPQFLNSIRYENNEEALNVIGDRKNAMLDTYVNIYRQTDNSRFMDNINVSDIINMINWLSEGFEKEMFRKGDPDIDEMSAEFGRYLELLRSHFYRSSTDVAVSEAKEEQFEREETIMEEMKMDMTFEERLEAGKRPLVELPPSEEIIDGLTTPKVAPLAAGIDKDYDYSKDPKVDEADDTDAVNDEETADDIDKVDQADKEDKTEMTDSSDVDSAKESKDNESGIKDADEDDSELGDEDASEEEEPKDDPLDEIPPEGLKFSKSGGVSTGSTTIRPGGSTVIPVVSTTSGSILRPTQADSQQYINSGNRDTYIDSSDRAPYVSTGVIETPFINPREEAKIRDTVNDMDSIDEYDDYEGLDEDAPDESDTESPYVNGNMTASKMAAANAAPVSEPTAPTQSVFGVSSWQDRIAKEKSAGSDNTDQYGGVKVEKFNRKD